MDKYEYKVRSEEIKALIAQKEYAQAAEIADTIDWRRVKSVMMLCTISDLYKINRRYDDSYDLLLLAYDRHPGSRTIVYALCELSVKMGNVTQAWEYYKEYMQIAPKDSGRYILQYKIYEAEEVNLEERIAVLEELKKRDFREKWVYELAYLYHRIGLASKCVDECDELIAFYGDGKFVIKAMELKMLHEPLTPEQQMRYNNRFAPQEEVEPVAEEVVETEQEPVSQATTIWSGTHVAGPEGITEVEFAQTRRVPVEEIDIQVKAVGLNPGDTINLQEEVAAGVQQFLEEKSQNEEITRAIIAPMLETDTVDNAAVENALCSEAEETWQQESAEDSATTMTEAVQESASEEILTVEEDAQEPAEESVATMTEEVQELATEEAQTVEEEAQELVEESVATITEEMQELATEEAQAMIEEVQEPADESAGENMESAGELPQEQVQDTATVVMEQLRRESIEEPPKEIANLISMNPDGQLSMVMPEKNMVEKQITGQISFVEYLLEWEQKKKEIEVKSQENIRKIIERNTHQMFDEFQAQKRDGLLEQLENGRDLESVIAEAEGRVLDEDGVPVPKSLLEDYEPVAVEETETYETEETVTGLQQEPMEQELITEEEVYEQDTEAVSEQTEPAAVEDLEAEPLDEVTEAVSRDQSLEESVLTAEDEVEELVEIEYLTEEEPDAVSEAEENLSEEIFEETFEEEPEQQEETFEEESDAEALSEMDAAYEAALMGATADVEEGKEAGIDYETISMPADEVEAAIQQEAEKQRSLTREERELFSPYIQGRSSKVQLVHAIDNISMAAYTGNVIITGAEGLDTLGLAKNIIRNIQLTDSNFSGKIAKISGESLNKREVSAVLEGLDNGALIIQKANAMSAKTAESLHKALQQEHRGIVVLMEGTKKAMNAFLERNKKLQTCFTGRIDMEALSEAALVNFGKKYAREKEYSIDEFGGLALSRKIAERQTSDHAVTIMEVKEIIDAAIESASRKTLGHFFDVLLAKRYDDEDMIIIREKDFR